MANNVVHRRPKDDTSALDDEKLESIRQGTVTIKTSGGTRRWAVWETLGKGGYGTVTRGTNLGDGSEVALKFMKRTPKIMESESRLAWRDKVMAREVDVLKKIEHENIVRMVEHYNHADFPESDGSTTDSTLLVLEYASKGTLREYIHRTGHFDDELARTYFNQMLSGLEALHALHIAHRDLKPSNMLIDEDYTLKIADFGFSKKYYDAEEKKDIVETYADYGFVCDRSFGGTSKYRSPEINLAKKNKDRTFCGNQCDIFALGVTLFHVRVPPSRDLRLHRSGAFPFKIALDGSDDDWDILSTAIEHETNHKYADAEEYRKQFWIRHKQEDFDVKHSDVANLLFAMMHPNPLRRHNLFEVRQDKWMKGKTCSKEELKKQMDQRWITLCTHKGAKKNVEKGMKK